MADTASKILILKPKHALTAYPDVQKKLAAFTHSRFGEGLYVVHTHLTVQELHNEFAAALHADDSLCVISATVPCVHSGPDEDIRRTASLIV